MLPFTSFFSSPHRACESPSGRSRSWLGRISRSNAMPRPAVVLNSARSTPESQMPTPTSRAAAVGAIANCRGVHRSGLGAAVACASTTACKPATMAALNGSTSSFCTRAPTMASTMSSGTVRFMLRAITSIRCSNAPFTSAALSSSIWPLKALTPSATSRQFIAP